MSGGSEVMKGSHQLSTSMDKKEKDETKIHELVHYQQKYNWDCGLSCCLMVLNQKDRNFILNNLYCFIEEEGFGESTWTIDLCYILNRFKVKFKYTTITLGVDPGYIKENFYDKVLAKDSGRVNNRFEAAESKGMTITECTVTLEEILDHLDKTGPVIVLTNANLLTCTRCSNYISCYPSCFTSISYQAEMISVFTYLTKFLIGYFSRLVEQTLAALNPFNHISLLSNNLCNNLVLDQENSYHDSYQGHYVVLIGFDPDKREVLYRNPTMKDKVCHMPYDSLEESRTSYGTDEDVIFIFP